MRTWEQAAPGRTRKAYFRCFTACFLLITLFFLGVYLIAGREIIWNTDGMEQYLPFFVYEGEWLRDLFGGLFSGQGWQPQLWSWGLGYGGDTLSTLDVFWNPLNLLSALVPAAYAEYAFSFLVLLRMYLAGITFSFYSLYRGNGRFATLCGALVYCFAAPALIGTFWPGGVDPLVLFPLLLLGAEKILHRERPTVFIAAVALFFLISYYFAYAACIFLFFYCLVRAFMIEGRMGAKRFLGIVGRFIAFLLVGVLLACAALVPSAMQLLGTDRATTALTDINLFYSLSYYASIPGGFLANANVGSDCSIGFGGAAFLCCILLFLQKKQNTQLKVTFVVMTIMLLLPFFGSLLNGFNYATNRWMWAYDMCIAYIVVTTMAHLEKPEKRERNALILAMFILALIVLPLSESRTEAFAAAFAAMLAIFVAVLATQPSPESNRRYALAATIILALCVNIYYYTASGEGAMSSKSVPIGSGYTKLTTDSPNSVVAAIDDDTWWRYDADPAAVGSVNESWIRVYNDSLVQGLNGIDFYNSIYNNDIDHFHTELGIAADDVNFMYANLGGRSMLETLCNVKYFLMPDAGGETTPYNYGTTAANSAIVRGSSCTAYAGDNTLPLGFTYASTISRSTYEQLTPLQKQEALMQGVVISDEAAESSSVSETQPQSTSETVASQVVATDGITLEDGSFVATKSNATITLSFDGLENSETYLCLTNLDYTGLSSLALMSQASYDDMSWYRKAYTLMEDFNYQSPETYYVKAKSDKGSTNRSIVNSIKDWHMYGGKTDWALNLGYSADAQHTVTITLPSSGRYSFDDLSIVCQPMDNVNAQIDALGTDTLQNTEVSNDRLTGTISVSESKYLYLSIPYSDGWTALVDGQPATIEKANTAFMAIELSPGEHSIELTYCTPGLKLGGTLTLLGIVLFAGIILWYRRRDKRHTL